MFELIEDHRTGHGLEIVIPTFNEEKRIGNLLRYYGPEADIVVLDGGSTDQTVPLALTSGATVFRRLPGAEGEAYFVHYANEVTKSGLCFYLLADEFIRSTELAALRQALQTHYAVARCSKADWMYGRQMRTFNHTECRGFRRGYGLYDSEHLHENLKSSARPEEICPRLFELHHLNIWSVRGYFGKTGLYTSTEIQQFRRAQQTPWRFFRRYIASWIGFPLIKWWRETNIGLPRALFWSFFDLAEMVIAALAWIEQTYLLSPEEQLKFYSQLYTQPTETTTSKGAKS